MHGIPTQLYNLKLNILAVREHAGKLVEEEIQKALQTIYDNQYDETGQNKLDLWQRKLVEWYLLEIRANGLNTQEADKKKLLSSWGSFIDKYRTEYM